MNVYFPCVKYLERHTRFRWRDRRDLTLCMISPTLPVKLWKARLLPLTLDLVARVTLSS